MRNSKSIEDLISSICNLVIEAKREYENTKNIDLNESIFSEKIETEKRFNDEFKTSSYQNFDSERKQIINKEKDSLNWKSINFNKNSKKTSEKIYASNKVENFEDEVVKEKFNFLLNIWIEKNLNKLIELEFSNYLKVRNDQ